MTDEQPILDQAFVAELAATYVAEGAEQVAQVEAAAAAQNLEAIVRPAHSLKSSSASLGAARMSQIAREIEIAGREDRGDGIADLVAAARVTWDDTVSELRARGHIR
jgi:HPt (histidine-containing phosphotransfer) domain-containing protein